MFIRFVLQLHSATFGALSLFIATDYSPNLCSICLVSSLSGFTRCSFPLFLPSVPLLLSRHSLYSVKFVLHATNRSCAFHSPNRPLNFRAFCEYLLHFKGTLRSARPPLANTPSYNQIHSQIHSHTDPHTDPTRCTSTRIHSQLDPQPHGRFHTVDSPHERWPLFASTVVHLKGKRLSPLN